MNSINALGKAYRISNTQFSHLCWLKYFSSAATSSSTGSNIKIPNRIPRGPTDILKALEKTVSYDFTGPSYKFFDDPLLAPYQDRQARMYSLAKSSGRKAARWIRNEHPELFTQVISDPPVMSYMPAPPITPETVSEDLLFQNICDGKVSESIKIFELMQENKLDVAQDIQLSLLELLCFYNCEDRVPMENEAERYFAQKAYKDTTINTWKDHPLIKTLFESLKHLGSAPYSALICGLYENGAKPEGDKLVEEAKEKNITLDVNAYNAMLVRTISIYEKHDLKRNKLLDILREMNSKGVKPNIGTLNATMNALSRLGFSNKYAFSIQLMAEFNKQGVKPSIGTYGLMIRGLVGRSSPDSNLPVFLSSILNSLKGQSLEAREVSDLLFFEWAMKACAQCDSLPCAIDCLELFLHSKNRMLLNGLKTKNFYNNFFQVLSVKADFETLVRYYRLLCPHSHTAGPDLYTTLFDACDLNAAIREVPEFWKHYLGTGNLHEETILKMLEVAVNVSALPDPAAIETRPVLGELAANFLMYKIDTESQRVFEKVPLSTEMINFLLVLLARGAHWNGVQTCLKHMFEKDMWPEKNVITQLLDSCYAHDQPAMAVWVIKYCHANFGPKLEMQKLSAKVLNSEFLSENLKDEVKEVFDSDSGSSSSDGSSESDSDSGSDSDDSSESEDISVPKKPKQAVPKPDITKVTLK
ncbi:Protein PTCD3-like protein, mitochondrial [Frankliniella fusca]|uniref:Small ribosomal subunit protein mS39 n=1 Tax=Frankliniella fusca TaxID=407009 RepID=A0AAE1LJF0_9NEOP|nr:Protein PTCD3-like protein, mitochondrial [Frankliniella fusca]